MNLLCTLRWWGQANGCEVFEVSAGQGLSPALCRQRLTASPLPSDTAAMCGLCRCSTSATWAKRMRRCSVPPREEALGYGERSAAQTTLRVRRG